MSKLAQYRSTQQAIAQLQADLAKLEADGRVKKELEFEAKLEALLNEYGLSPAQALALIAPSSPSAKGERKKTRERTLSVYKNPHSGEIVESKGGNNRVLRAWKAQYGVDTVKGWKQA